MLPLIFEDHQGSFGSMPELPWRSHHFFLSNTIATYSTLVGGGNGDDFVFSFISIMFDEEAKKNFILVCFRSCEWPPCMAISDRPASRQTALDKIKSSDWSKVGMLYLQGGHWGRWVWQGWHMLQRENKTNKGRLSLAMPHSNFWFC